LRTKARYASDVRTARAHADFVKEAMLIFQVNATKTANAFTEAKARGVGWDQLATLQGIAVASQRMYMDRKHDWYGAVDDLEAKTRRFETYIKIGQWEESGMDVPDPETATYNLDPDSY
jgi:hypothetical protein